MVESNEVIEFENYLKRKQLAPLSVKYYLDYYLRFHKLLIEADYEEVNQFFVNSFIDLYPHIVARAFLRNYLEFLHRKDIDIPKPTGRKIRKEQITIPKNELEIIREGLYEREAKYGLIFDLTLTGALRRHEVLSIKGLDLDFSTPNKLFIIIKKGKGNKERKVFIREEIRKVLVSYLKMLKEQGKSLKLSDYLFESPRTEGKPLSDNRWNEVFLETCRNKLGKNYHPHQLRGTRATDWFDKGIDIVRIQQRLGHSDISTTMLYIKPDVRKELKLWSEEND